VRVVEGLDQCSEAGSEERDFLLGLNAPPDQRLACQVCVQGDVDIEYIGL
jgi:ferredoxin